MCPEGARHGDDALRGIRRRLREVVLAIPSDKGVYAVCFYLKEEARITSRTGRRLASVGPGLVLYVGSAGGPGGLRARLSRHLAGEHDGCWWHVDCISRAADEVVFVYYKVGQHGTASEDALSESLLSLPQLRPLYGIGNTDSREPHTFICSCVTPVVKALRSLGGVVLT